MSELTPLQSHFVERARHLEAIEACFGDELTPVGWRILDHAYRATLRDAEEAGCHDEVWGVLFPHADTRDVLRALRGPFMQYGEGGGDADPT